MASELITPQMIWETALSRLKPDKFGIVTPGIMETLKTLKPKDDDEH